MKTLKHIVNAWCGSAILALAAGAAIAATPGELDPSFGSGGISRTGYGDLAQADDLVVDRDGNTYTAGTSTTAGVVIPLLTKYRPDGSLDSSFGSGGSVTPAAPPANVAAYSALTLYRNTLYQMIAADDRLYVYAFDTNGVAQTWFGSGGVASFAVGMAIYPVFDIAQWGNYLALAASARNPAGGNLDFVVVELTLAGAPVPSFGSGGIAYSRIWSGAGARNRLTGLAYQPDGRIVVGGRAAKPGELYDYVAGRLRLDGTPDPTFGLAGFRVIDFGGDDFGRRVALRKDGRIVIGGSVCRTVDPVDFTQYCYAGAAGIKPDGSLDTAFGGAGSGRSVQDLGGGGVTVTDLILDERERPLLVGQHLDAIPAGTDPVSAKAFVLRLKSVGTLDTSYLGGGWADFSYGYESSSNGGVKLYPGSRVVTAGTTTKLVAPTVLIGVSTVARHVN